MPPATSFRRRTAPPPTAGPTQAQCTAAINFIQKQMNVVVPRSYKQALGFVKIDWRPTDRNTVQLRFERHALAHRRTASRLRPC